MSSQALKPVYWCVNQKLQSMRHTVSTDDYHTVVSLVERRAPIDYDRLAEAFALHYLWPNTHKAKQAIQSSKSLGASFLDLGCGPGSASLGALMASLDGGAGTPSKFLLVDSSMKQLELASDMLLSVRDTLDLTYTVDILQTDVLALELSHISDGYETILISHLLCELGVESKKLTQQIAGEVSIGKQAIVIEQVDDIYWDERLYSLLRDDQVVEHSDHLASLRLPDAVGGQTAKAQWRLRWRTLKGPPNSWMGTLISEYFRAWNEADVDKVSQLFTSSAEYLHRPRSAPLRSSSAISHYWRREILEKQYNVEARPIEVGFASQRAWIYWSASYSLKDGSDRQLIGFMVLDFDLDTKRIRRLTEVYRSTPSGDLEERDQWLR